MAESVITVSLTTIIIIYSDFGANLFIYLLELEYLSALLSEISLFCHIGSQVYYSVSQKHNVNLKWNHNKAFVQKFVDIGTRSKFLLKQFLGIRYAAEKSFETLHSFGQSRNHFCATTNSYCIR